MKAVILAGGYGTRLSEETVMKPKPIVEIGGKPIIWHIMKAYSAYGINDFIICLGYKGYMVKEYFANYFLHQSDITINLKDNQVKVHQHTAEPWSVTLIDTGETTQTAGRLLRVRKYLDEQEDFCFIYGDGVSNINFDELRAFHRRQGTLATLTAVQPPGRFGALDLDLQESRVLDFKEKPVGDGRWISGGFFILSPLVLDYIADDTTVWEREPLEALAVQGQLSAYKHSGFWYAMDSQKDKNHLEDLWAKGKPPWKVWDNALESSILAK
jgi:glucose-1-phosphate cytidylyltransferase